jgi:GMP synthase-like glutamine amidotransferase
MGENFRCVQFHPEMNPEILRFLLTPRRQMLLERTGVDIEELLPTIQETPESRSLFSNFARYFLGWKPVHPDPATSL